jgi:hypothetical protein
MKSQHRICAEMHLQFNPAETRTVDQLEAYYRSLSMSSPFAPLVQAFKEADAQAIAEFEASVAINNARKG